MTNLLHFCFMSYGLIALLLIGLMAVMMLRRTLRISIENIIGMVFTAFCWPVVLAMTIVELFKSNE
jgi:hypothetical protein